MPHFARQRFMSTQPSQANVAFGNPLCHRLVYAGVPNGVQFNDAAQGQRSVIATGTPVQKNNVAGRAITTSATAYYTVNRRGNMGVATTGAKHTLFAVFKTGASATGTVVGLGGVTDANDNSTLTISTSDGTICHTVDNTDASSGTTPATSTLYKVGIAIRASNDRTFCINGKITTNSTSITDLACAAGMTIGTRYLDQANQSGKEFVGDIMLVAVWSRALTNLELRALYENPWQIFATYPRRPFVQPAAATGIAFDAAANSADQAAASSYSGSASWSGSSRFLAVDVSCLGAGVTVTAMTYGGATCTKIGSRATVTSFGSVECWGIKQTDPGAPGTGSNTLAVTLSGSLEFAVEWTSYTGVNQTTPTEAFNSNQATNVGATDATVTVTTVSDNCWVHAAVVASDTSITAGNTTRNNISGTLGSGANEDNNAAKTPAGAVAMSYTNVGALATWAIAGYGIIPTADFEAAFRKTLSGVGSRVGARQSQGWS